jgi:hypothetical protein
MYKKNETANPSQNQEAVGDSLAPWYLQYLRAHVHAREHTQNIQIGNTTAYLSPF